MLWLSFSYRSPTTSPSSTLLLAKRLSAPTSHSFITRLPSVPFPPFTSLHPFSVCLLLCGTFHSISSHVPNSSICFLPQTFSASPCSFFFPPPVLSSFAYFPDPPSLSGLRASSSSYKPVVHLQYWLLPSASGICSSLTTSLSFLCSCFFRWVFFFFPISHLPFCLFHLFSWSRLKCLHFTKHDVNVLPCSQRSLITGRENEQRSTKGENGVPIRTLDILLDCV